MHRPQAPAPTGCPSIRCSLPTPQCWWPLWSGCWTAKSLLLAVTPLLMYKAAGDHKQQRTAGNKPGGQQGVRSSKQRGSGRQGSKAAFFFWVKSIENSTFGRWAPLRSSTPRSLRKVSKKEKTGHDFGATIPTGWAILWFPLADGPCLLFYQTAGSAPWAQHCLGPGSPGYQCTILTGPTATFAKVHTEFYWAL